MRITISRVLQCPQQVTEIILSFERAITNLQPLLS